VLGRAVEHLFRHQAFAARQMDAALSTLHHIFTGRGAAGARLGVLSELHLVRLEKPIHKDDDEDYEKVFQCRSS
jgi:hypothetical protein